jgi:hypothetical protein
VFYQKYFHNTHTIENGKSVAREAFKVFNYSLLSVSHEVSGHSYAGSNESPGVRVTRVRVVAAAHLQLVRHGAKIARHYIPTLARSGLPGCNNQWNISILLRSKTIEMVASGASL